MKRIFEDDDIRDFLAAYEVHGPRPELVARVKYLMHEEMSYATAARAETVKAGPVGAVMLLSGMSLALVLNLFYMLAVGTVLKLTLPATWTVYVTRSLLWMPSAGVALLAGTLLIITFKLFQDRTDRVPVREA